MLHGLRAHGSVPDYITAEQIIAQGDVAQNQRDGGRGIAGHDRHHMDRKPEIVAQDRHGGPDVPVHHGRRGIVGQHRGDETDHRPGHDEQPPLQIRRVPLLGTSRAVRRQVRHCLPSSGTHSRSRGFKVNHKPSSAAYNATNTTVSNMPVSGTRPVM